MPSDFAQCRLPIRRARPALACKLAARQVWQDLADRAGRIIPRFSRNLRLSWRAAADLRQLRASQAGAGAGMAVGVPVARWLGGSPRTERGSRSAVGWREMMDPGSPRLLAAGAVGGVAELWRRSVSIGAALAEARQRAGLTVAQVSERTRIRETVIRGIERDDYSGCGGDFYARGHIRGIAKAVGADPGPLVEEYDAVCRSPDVLSTVSLEELLATSAQAPRRRRPALPAVSGLVPPPVRRCGTRSVRPQRVSQWCRPLVLRGAGWAGPWRWRWSPRSVSGCTPLSRDRGSRRLRRRRPGSPR
jgi:transcriptional regulator with XRE-family HTH domain